MGDDGTDGRLPKRTISNSEPAEIVWREMLVAWSLVGKDLESDCWDEYARVRLTRKVKLIVRKFWVQLEKLDVELVVDWCLIFIVPGARLHRYTIAETCWSRVLDEQHVRRGSVPTERIVEDRRNTLGAGRIARRK